MCFPRTFVFLVKSLTSWMVGSRIRVFWKLSDGADTTNSSKPKRLQETVQFWQSCDRKEAGFQQSSATLAHPPAFYEGCWWSSKLPTFQQSTWQALEELRVLAPRLLCPDKASRLLACFQLAWWRVEKPPELAFPAPSAQLLSRPSFYGLWSGSTFPGVDPDTL